MCTFLAVLTASFAINLIGMNSIYPLLMLFSGLVTLSQLNFEKWRKPSVTLDEEADRLLADVDGHRKEESDGGERYDSYLKHVLSTRAGYIIGIVWAIILLGAILQEI